MTLLRLVFRLVALPGRMLVRGIDQAKASNGVGPLNGFQRGFVHSVAWFGVFMLFALATASPSTASGSRADSSVASTPGTTTSRRVPAQTPAQLPQPPIAGESVTVARVIDGDTFELADGRKVRVLGIDSCESDTPGGGLATSDAITLLTTGGASVHLITEPGVTTDRYGRQLRYVQVGGQDFGTYMVGYDHTGVYQGNNDANEVYVGSLYARDLDHAASPPSGRECGEYPPAVTTDNDDTYVPLPDNDDHRESRFCRGKWWC